MLRFSILPHTKTQILHTSLTILLKECLYDVVNVLKFHTLYFLFSSKMLVCFVALRPKSTAMVMAGRSVHLTTFFPGHV